MISRKIRTNAIIAYFFLGWIFLLARNNPDFSDAFIRRHAKIATRWHLVFLVGYSLYVHFLDRFFAYMIPLLGITIDRIVDLSIFSALTIFILMGAYRANRWDEAEDAIAEGIFDTTASANTSVIEYPDATERDRMIFLLAHLPFIGETIAHRYPSIITSRGANISTLFALIYISYFSYAGFDSTAMILLFLSVLFAVWLAARFFFSHSYAWPSYLARFPSVDRVWQIARSIPGYLRDIVRAVFGGWDALSFRSSLSRIEAWDASFHSSMTEHFTDLSLPLSPLLIFVPFINIMYLPKLLITRDTRYVIAIGQGLMITVISATFLFVYDVSSRTQTILLFPIFLGMAHVHHNPFYRIPVIYELYALINTLSFGLFENTRKIRATKAKEQSVSFKVQ